GETTFSIFVTTSGNYSVEVSYFGCVETDDVNVNFAELPIVDLGEDIFVCGKVFATLDGTPDNIDDFDEVFYQWFFNGVLIDGATEATLVVTEIGDYTVEVTSPLDCSGSDTISVIISDYTVDLGVDVTLCENASYEIIPVVTGIDPSEATYLWSTGETTFSIVVTTSGNYSVEVSYGECVETDDINVNFRELPIIELGINIIKCADDVVTLNATPSSNVSANFTYTWFYNGGIINNETSSTLDVTEAGIYAVEVNDDGCISTDDIVIEFYANQRCVISQGISPNGDGLNDCLDLLFLDDQLSIVKLSIFNRHGRLVYEQNDYINQWCGQSNNGEVLPTGNYFYVITLQNDPAISGYIYLNK
nr:gliding motility-associated C-terminal domain-containing protein [Flavobacteriales bacterium]